MHNTFFVESYKLKIYSVILEEMESQSIRGFPVSLGYSISPGGFTVTMRSENHVLAIIYPCWHLLRLSECWSLAFRDQAMHFAVEQTLIWASQVVLVVKTSPANTGDARDEGSIPGSGRSPGEGNGNPLQYSCLGIPWTEEPGGLQSMGYQRVRHDWAHTHKPSLTSARTH